MILHIIQARSTSTRLPNKILQKIGDKTLLEWHLENTMFSCNETINTYHRYSDVINDITTVIATPKNEKKLKEIDKIAGKYNVIGRNPDCSENDVLKRFVIIAKEFSPDWIIRTTSDCIMDKDWYIKTVAMAVRNNIPIFNTYKEGSCTEVFKYSDLLRADSELPSYESAASYTKNYGLGQRYIDNFKDYEILQHREHVTTYFRKGFSKDSIDTPEDLEMARKKYGKN